MPYITYWNKEYDMQGNIYSCDMIRINFDMGKRLQEFVDYIAGRTWKIIEHKSIKIFTYREMLAITINEKSFMLAWGFNTAKGISSTGVIEFNPNKLMNEPQFVRLWENIKLYSYDLEVKRYDLAIDIPLPRNLVSMGKQGNKIYRYTHSDSITETLGRHNYPGFTKLYDKTKESKVNYDITRIEITLEKNQRAIEELPKIYIKDYQIAFKEENKLSKNDKVFLKLLEDIENPDFYLAQLTSRKKNKLQEFLSRKEFNLDDKTAEKIRFYVMEMERKKI